MPVKMTTVKPDSFLTMLRQWLARKLDVNPEPDSFWCIGCSLEGGKTLIQYTKDMEVVKQHVRQHPPGDTVAIRIGLAQMKDSRD